MWMIYAISAILDFICAGILATYDEYTYGFMCIGAGFLCAMLAKDGYYANYSIKEE